ncbi:carboxy terminal-processing peptidase [Puniceicoccus vermicola]|uniref:Carboxy terminal-processing peptidase n=1 Tax=Puniceicoccus vermicola TaxID=388746 RepID=A0A7X1E4D6_9BACT|nr:carboxy terminal-processing peptidase [Puniceicoccus vermicola]MBC2601954.1 carboxy terminal-processing peptidase [Puniceicoccus vermicola]
MASGFDVGRIIGFPWSVRFLPLFALSLGLTSVLSSSAAAEEEVFEATGLMRAETRWLVNSLERLHFSEMALEDIDMSDVIDSYMEDLDYNHLYFTAADEKAFRSRFAPPMARYLRSGNLHPAFQIFSVFQENALERVAWVREYLENDFKFDEELEYQADRQEVTWAENEAELDELWKRRIQFELLNEVIAKMSPPDPEQDLEIGLEGMTEPDGEIAAIEEEIEPEEPLSFDDALVEAKEVVSKRYDRLETEMERFESAEVQEIFLTTLANSYDPHSIFLSSDSLEDLSIAIENSLVGIGAVLADEDGYCTVRELIPGGPARLSEQIDVNDQILAVAQGKKGEYVDVVDMKLRKIVKMIRGEKESIVRLKIRPAEAADPSARKEVVLVRDEVQLTANLARARLYQIPMDDRTVSIGVIDLPSFYGSDLPDHPNSSDDVAELISKMKTHGVEGMILDLRNNGGGLLSEAVELAGLFIPTGPVVQVKTVQGDLLHHDDRDPSVAWNGPLMVLVSKFTASASEIVAGALQNYGRAIVVGDESTHGKGTVQGIFRMTPPLFYSLSASRSDVGATKVTVQKYYLPNGESTQLEGVKSDVVIPSMNSLISIGEADLDHSMEWDTITPVSFGIEKDDAMDLVLVDDSLIESLREQSQSRMDSLEEFSYLDETIEFFKKRKDEKLISLNLVERQKQQDSDRTVRTAFRERRDELSASKYSYEPILLDTEEIAEEGVDEDENDSDSSFDIVLREGIRIMADWLSEIPEPQSSQAKNDLAKVDA